MPVSFINYTTGSQTSSATTGTLSLTALTSAPAAGQWIFVAFMSNDPTNVSPTGATCGTIPLGVIDSGDYSQVPVLYGAPYQSGMSTTVTVTWGNGLGRVSRGMYATCIVIGGAAATPIYYYNHLKSYNSLGLFDGTSGSYDIGSSNGTSQASGATLSWTKSSGIQTSYDSQKQPFILATWNGVSAYTLSSTLNGAATIASGVITTSSQSSGTVVLNNAAPYGTTGTAYLPTPDGVLPFSWTGKSGNNLTGCSGLGGSASGFYNYSLASGTGAYINYPVLIQTPSITAAQPINGWQMGTNVNNGIGISVATAAVSGVQVAGQLTISFGQSSGLTSTPAYLVTSGPANPCGSVMVTLVPTTRKMSRGSNVVDSINAITKKRVAKKIQVILNDAALIRKRVVKTAKATINNIAKFNKRIAKSVIAAYNNIPIIHKNVIKIIKSAYSNTFVVGRTLRKNLRSTSQQTNSLISNRRYARFRSAISTYNINAYFIRAIRRSKKAYTTYNNAATASRVINRTRLSTVRILQLFNINRIKRYNKKASAAISNAAVVTRTRNYGRFGKVTISYSIASTRRRSSIRIAIATVNSIAKNIARRPFYIFHTNDIATSTNFYQSGGYTITNNVDVAGEFTNANDLPPSDYNEPGMTTPNDYNEPGMTTPNDYTEPDWPTGEDVVPT